MRLLIFAGIAFVFAYSPIYLYETFVEPELQDMAQTYSHADEIAQKAAGTAR